MFRKCFVYFCIIMFASSWTSFGEQTKNRNKYKDARKSIEIINGVDINNYTIKRTEPVTIRNSIISKVILENHSTIDSSSIYELTASGKIDVINSRIDHIKSVHELMITEGSRIQQIHSTNNIKVANSSVEYIESNGYLFFDSSKVGVVKIMTNGIYIWNTDVDVLELNYYNANAKDLAIYCLGSSTIGSISINSSATNNKITIYLDKVSTMSFDKDKVRGKEYVEYAMK